MFDNSRAVLSNCICKCHNLSTPPWGEEKILCVVYWTVSFLMLVSQSFTAFILVLVCSRYYSVSYYIPIIPQEAAGRFPRDMPWLPYHLDNKYWIDYHLSRTTNVLMENWISSPLHKVGYWAVAYLLEYVAELYSTLVYSVLDSKRISLYLFLEVPRKDIALFGKIMESMLTVHSNLTATRLHT